MRRTPAVLTAALIALSAVPAAASADTGMSVTAIGTADVRIPKTVAQNDAAIRAAVKAAREKAGPAAVGAAKVEAQRLATAAGLTLGGLISVAEIAPGSPFGPFSPYGADGTFGPGKFCGTIVTRTSRVVKGKRTFRLHRHHGCRVPSEVSQSVTATYAAT